LIRTLSVRTTVPETSPNVEPGYVLIFPDSVPAADATAKSAAKERRRNCMIEIRAESDTWRGFFLFLCLCLFVRCHFVRVQSRSLYLGEVAKLGASWDI
jgi:hypothetical protein